MRPPSMASHLLLGHLPEMRRDRLGLYLRAGRLGDVVQMRFLNRTGVLIAHPDLARQVLTDASGTFNKQTRGYDTLRIALGEGLVTSEGDFWRRQRRIAQPAFHKRRIEGFAETMTRETTRMLDRWAGVAPTILDVDAEMMDLTFRIVGRCLCSVDLADASADIGGALEVLLPAVVKRVTNPFTLPLSVPTPQNRAFQGILDRMDQVVFDIIEGRRGKVGAHGDLLDMLMEATDEETGEGMSDKHLRDEILTIILAGHETTSNALTWTLHLLSRHPAIAIRVREEIAVLEGAPPSVEDLRRLPYTEAVIKESMRILPPVWNVARNVAADTEIGGFDIPAGWMVFISPYVLHRDARFWDNPEGFDPERFLEPRSKSIHKGAYLPFIMGPRQCIGAGFAMMEAHLLLTSILQRFDLALVPGHPVVPSPTVTLRPKHGLKMQVRPVGG